METITIIGANSVEHVRSLYRPDLVDAIISGPEDMSVSDGYHTFDELYDHRITLYIALCKEVDDRMSKDTVDVPRRVWRSKTHSDGSVMEGWFVLGIGREKNEQITYHLPLQRWNETIFAEELERAPEWDGHTSADVLGRLALL